MTRPPFGRGRRAARVLALVIDAASWAGARTPPRVAHGLAALGGTLEWALRPHKREQLATNLAHVVDEPPGSQRVRRLVRCEIRNEARRSADLLWALGDPEELLATIEMVGIDHARDATTRGGVIIAGTHLGGWEVATAVPAAVLGVPTSVIVADDWLAWAIEDARVAAGLQVLYRPRAALSAVRALRRGEALLVLGDDGRQSGHRIEVEFLGQRARLPAGVAALSRMSQTPVVTFCVLPLGIRRWRITTDPPLGPPARRSGHDGERELLQALADRWTTSIRAHPEQWAASYPIDWVE